MGHRRDGRPGHTVRQDRGHRGPRALSDSRAPRSQLQGLGPRYGLVDSEKIDATPGTDIELQATVAASEAEAAQVYPANYWYSLIEPPDASEFPGTGPDGNGISTNLQTQGQWVDIQKQGCMLCHQLGTRIVREIENIDEFDSSLAAWDYRVQMGQRGGQMTNVMSRFGRQRGLQMFADWSDRIAAGALPPKPPRPQGVERNVVTTGEGGPCLALGGSFVLERYGETRCVP